nr:nuclear prelamin A recognition factor [Loxodonta africana]
MKCEHCTRKECSKKTKTDDQENALADAMSPTREKEEKCDTSEHRVLAVSVCPQSLPYFAAKFNLSVTDASRRLCGFLKSLGVRYVFDTTIAADFSILESQKEFVRRYLGHSEDKQALPMLTSACPGWVRYAERVLGSPGERGMVVPEGLRGGSARRGTGWKPLCGGIHHHLAFTSHHRGHQTREGRGSVHWSSPESLKAAAPPDSPPAAMGRWIAAPCSELRGHQSLATPGGHRDTLLHPHATGTSFEPPASLHHQPDHRLAVSAQNLSPDGIFHVIVGPCYDKKLEALREDVQAASHTSQGVDCVLTSGELLQIMEQSELSVKEAAVDTLFGDLKEEEVRRHDGASSDGYLAHVFRHAAKELFGEDVEKVTCRALRNKDFQEVTLEKEGEVVLRFAAVYGFRNIQNMILKLKKGKFPYHFVEVLACPGGCLHGRGQAQAEDGHVDKALLRQMEGIYADIPVRPPETSEHVQMLYREWLHGADPPRVQEALHTSFPSAGLTASSLDIKW